MNQQQVRLTIYVCMVFQLAHIGVCSAAPKLCPERMSPIDCANAQLEAAGEKLGEFKSIVAGLEDKIRLLQAQIVEFKDAKPPNAALKIETEKRILNISYLNDSGRTRLVVVSGVNVGAMGNAMCANVAAMPADLTKGETCNPTTTARAEFAVANYFTSLSFLVPNGFSYRVATNGANVKREIWTEADF